VATASWAGGVPPAVSVRNLTKSYGEKQAVADVSFEVHTAASPWAWQDLFVVAVWVAIGALVAVRRWESSPRRA
jgi:hypothetical protein